MISIILIHYESSKLNVLNSKHLILSIYELAKKNEFTILFDHLLLAIGCAKDGLNHTCSVISLHSL